MKLLFTPEALASYNEIKSTSYREADLVKDILKDILAHPESGKGAPQSLMGALSGLWSREYGLYRQIVYQIFTDEVKVFAIGKNILSEISPEDACFIISMTTRMKWLPENGWKSTLTSMK